MFPKDKEAKLAVLQEIMDLMGGTQADKLATKRKPSVVEMSVTEAAPADMAKRLDKVAADKGMRPMDGDDEDPDQKVEGDGMGDDAPAEPEGLDGVLPPEDGAEADEECADEDDPEFKARLMKLLTRGK